MPSLSSNFCAVISRNGPNLIAPAGFMYVVGKHPIHCCGPLRGRRAAQTRSRNIVE